MIEKIRSDDEKRYNAKLQEELAKQKEQILEELYAPPSNEPNDSPYSEFRAIGYQAAKERFESQKK
jgi:hypothetical protein